MNPGGQAARGSPDKPKKIRAFLALKTPVEWDEEFARLQVRLKSQLRTKAIRWTTPEQIHITLRFLGYIVPEEAEGVAAGLPEICAGHDEFGLRCNGLGCFPNVRRPRVLWAALEGDVARVQELQRAVVEATRSIGEAPDEREFKPHLTIARVEQLERSTRDELEEIVAKGFRIQAAWRVTELLLMRSHLSAQGAKYEVIGRCGLSGRE